MKADINKYSLYLILWLVFFVACGSSGSDEDSENVPVVTETQTEEIAPCAAHDFSVDGSVGGNSLNESFYGYSSVLFNQTGEQALLDEAYDYFGLDPLDGDDADLLYYVFSGADYRLIVANVTGVRLSVFFGIGAQVAEDFDVFVYDLDDYELGTPIAITDTSAIEATFRDGDNDAALNQLIAMFEGFRDDGVPNAVAGFNPDRSLDDLLLQDFVNVFSPRTTQASGGTVTLDAVVASDESVNTGILAQPFADVARVGGEFAVNFGAESLSGTYCLESQVSEGTSDGDDE